MIFYNYSQPNQFGITLLNEDKKYFYSSLVFHFQYCYFLKHTRKYFAKTYPSESGLSFVYIFKEGNIDLETIQKELLFVQTYYFFIHNPLEESFDNANSRFKELYPNEEVKSKSINELHSEVLECIKLVVDMETKSPIMPNYFTKPKGIDVYKDFESVAPNYAEELQLMVRSNKSSVAKIN